MNPIGKIQGWVHRTIPQIYTEAMSYYELLEAIMAKLDEVIDSTNEFLKQDLEDYIVKILNEWMEDGTLDTIINQGVFGQINADITELKNTKQSIDTLHFVDVIEYQKKMGLTFTTAMQRVLDMAKGDGIGVHAVVKTGKYDLTAELRAYADTVIESQEGVEYTRKHNGYMLMTDARGSSTTGYSGAGNIRVTGGVWNCNGVAYPSKASGFRFSHGKGFIVERVEIKDPANSHHIEFNACADIHVRENRFLGWAGTADTFNEAIQLDIAMFGVTDIGADDSTPCKDVWIENNYFGNSGTVGSNSIGRAIGAHNSVMGKAQTNINISGNTIEDTLSWAIRAYNWEDVSIKDNIFRRVGAGINVRAAITGVDTMDSVGNQVGAEPLYNFTITGNNFRRTTSKGRMIEIYGESGTSGKIYGAIVSDNTIDMTGSTTSYDAIDFSFTEDITCTGNRIKNCTGRGIIVVTSSHSATISGNTLKSIGEDGIYLGTGCNYITVTGNIVQQTGYNGLYANSNELVTIADNIFGGVNGKNDADPRNHIRMVTACDLVTITGNICRNFSTTHSTGMAIYVTNTCKNVRVTDNITKGFTNSINPVNGSLDSLGNMI